LKHPYLLPSIALLAVICLSCGERGSWFLDGQYSRHLLGSAEAYGLLTNQDPSETVDALQIYRTPSTGAALFEVDDIRETEWLYESSDPLLIRRFFQAARDSADAGECNPARSAEVIHVLAFDRDLMRVGYLRYYPCPEQGLGASSPFGTTSLYFSRSLHAMIRAWAR
jgi:hypothetical protein